MTGHYNELILNVSVREEAKTSTSKTVKEKKLVNIK